MSLSESMEQRAHALARVGSTAIRLAPRCPRTGVAVLRGRAPSLREIRPPWSRHRRGLGCGLVVIHKHPSTVLASRHLREVLRDSAPEQVRHRGGGGVVPPDRTQVEDALDSRKEQIVGILVKKRGAR
jgi:hypothetical protein